MKKELKQEKDNKPKPVVYTYQFKVNRSNTLLEFLLTKIDGSRNTIKRILADHKVLINGFVVTQFNYPLAKDDEIKIAKFPIREDLKNQKKKTNENKSKFNLEIIFENESYIAINKPNGLLSVQSDNDRNSAYMMVEEYLRKKDPKSRAYQLHRIDKETSGVLVFAKDIKIHSMLKGHWNEDIKTREYYAVINGNMENEKGTIISYLKENKNNLVYSTNDPKGKKAITNYEVINHNNFYSLLKVCIDTGRKNQIRVHMADKGHPIVGDDKYGDGTSPFNRLGLHASRLDFVDPETKEIITIKAPIPKDFKDLFKENKND